MRQDFQAIGDLVLSEGDTDDAVVVEQRTDLAFQRLAARKAAWSEAFLSAS